MPFRLRFPITATAQFNVDPDHVYREKIRSGLLGKTLEMEFVHFSETHRIFNRDIESPVDPEKVLLPPYYPDHPIARRDWANYLECIQVLDKKGEYF